MWSPCVIYHSTWPDTTADNTYKTTEHRQQPALCQALQPNLNNGAITLTVAPRTNKHTSEM